MTLSEEQRSNYAPAFLARVERKYGAPARKPDRRKPEPEQVDRRNPVDLHGAARQVMRHNGMPVWVRGIVFDAAVKHGVSAASIVLKLRARAVVAARNEALYRVKEANPDLSLPKIGGWFGMDHTTVIYALARHAEATGDCPLTDYNLDKALRARRAANRKARLQNQSEA